MQESKEYQIKINHQAFLTREEGKQQLITYLEQLATNPELDFSFSAGSGRETINEVKKFTLADKERARNYLSN